MSAVAFSMWFSNVEAPELTETVFEHPLLAEGRLCTRGRSEPFTFQWSSAVRALAILMIRAKAAGDSIEGESGSYAATLDYAVGKGPAWLSDMFGTDGDNHSLLLRLIDRTNPERKRPGPVRIGVRSGALPPRSISIFLEGRQLAERRELLNLARRIAGAGADGARHRRGRPRRTVEPFDAMLERLMIREAESSLAHPDRLLPRPLARTVGRFLNEDRLRHLGGEGLSGFRELLRPKPVEARLGIGRRIREAREHLSGGRPIRISIAPSQVGSLLLLRNLHERSSVPLDIRYSFAHSTRLAERLVGDWTSEDGTDAAVLTLAPSAFLLGHRRNRFAPRMLMPPQSYRVVAPPLGGRFGQPYRGTFLVVADPCSSALLRLDSLCRMGRATREDFEVVPSEVDEAMHALPEGRPDLRSILGFPYYSILAERRLGRIVGRECEQRAGDETVLFFEGRFAADRSRADAFELLLRDAWLSLASDPIRIRLGVRAILRDTDYAAVIRRTSGTVGTAP